MKKKLDAGTTLIVDRYSFSGVAFTAAKQVLYKYFNMRGCAVDKKALAQ